MFVQVGALPLNLNGFGGEIVETLLSIDTDYQLPVHHTVSERVVSDFNGRRCSPETATGMVHLLNMLGQDFNTILPKWCRMGIYPTVRIDSYVEWIPPACIRLSSHWIACLAEQNLLAVLQEIPKIHLQPELQDLGVAYKTAYQGHLECLQYLVESGASINGGTLEAACQGGHVECAKYLHSKNVPVNTQALHSAAKFGHLECLRWLLETNQNNTSVLQNDLQSVSYHSISGGHQECVRLLETFGAKHTQKDLPPQTVYRVLEGGHLETLEYLLARGFSLPVSASLNVVKSGHLECLQKVISLGASCYPKTFEVAVTCGNSECVQFLCDTFSPIPEETLNIACIKVNLACVKILVRNGLQLQKDHIRFSHCLMWPNCDSGCDCGICPSQRQALMKYLREMDCPVFHGYQWDTNERGYYHLVYKGAETS